MRDAAVAIVRYSRCMRACVPWAFIDERRTEAVEEAADFRMWKLDRSAMRNGSMQLRILSLFAFLLSPASLCSY